METSAFGTTINHLFICYSIMLNIIHLYWTSYTACLPHAVYCLFPVTLALRKGSNARDTVLFTWFQPLLHKNIHDAARSCLLNTVLSLY
jgi:hypothetical protein